MVRYYNQKYTSMPIFNCGNKIFLNTTDIHTTYLFTKLYHYYLGSYIVEKRVGPMLYYLKLLLVLFMLQLKDLKVNQ